MSLLKTLFGLAAGAAAVGTAAYLLNRELQADEYEHIVTAEDEVEPEEGTPTEEPVAPIEEPVAPIEEPVAPTEEPVVPIEEPVAPIEEPVAPTEAKKTAKAKKIAKKEKSAEATEDETPNANPVEQAAAQVPLTEDGKLDATKIADPADFGDWEEQGCKG